MGINLKRRNLLSGNRQNSPFRLPWVAQGKFSSTEHQFLENCSQCGKCAEKCPENIIKIGRGRYPEVMLDKGECTFCEECVAQCDDVEFITDKSPHNAWHSHLEIKQSCLATNNIYCQSCQEQCETQAIRFKFIDNAIPKPVVDQDLCTACGACIAICPQSAIALTNTE